MLRFVTLDTQEMAKFSFDESTHYRKAPPFTIAPESKWFVVLLAMIVSLPSFSIDSCLASLSNIGASLHAPPAATALVLGLFMAGFGCGQVIFGPLCDRFGRRPTLLLGASCLRLPQWVAPQRLPSRLWSFGGLCKEQDRRPVQSLSSRSSETCLSTASSVVGSSAGLRNGKRFGRLSAISTRLTRY